MPLIALGVAGVELTVIAIVLAEDVPQLFVAVTLSVPELAAAPKSNVTLLPLPLIVVLAPVYVQLYVVTVGSLGTVYTTPVWPWHTVAVDCEKLAGVAGIGSTVMA